MITICHKHQLSKKNGTSANGPRPALKTCQKYIKVYSEHLYWSPIWENRRNQFAESDDKSSRHCWLRLFETFPVVNLGLCLSSWLYGDSIFCKNVISRQFRCCPPLKFLNPKAHVLIFPLNIYHVNAPFRLLQRKLVCTLIAGGNDWLNSVSNTSNDISGLVWFFWNLCFLSKFRALLNCPLITSGFLSGTGLKLKLT